MDLLLLLIVLGLVFYFIEMIPMADPFPKIIRVVAIVIAVVAVLQWLGFDLGIPVLHLGR